MLILQASSQARTPSLRAVRTVPRACIPIGLLIEINHGAGQRKPCVCNSRQRLLDVLLTSCTEPARSGERGDSVHSIRSSMPLPAPRSPSLRTAASAGEARPCHEAAPTLSAAARRARLACSRPNSAISPPDITVPPTHGPASQHSPLRQPTPPTPTFHDSRASRCDPGRSGRKPRRLDRRNELQETEDEYSAPSRMRLGRKVN